ncbi:MAG: PEP-CTERM sorting domain-containing protein [Pseudomonadota bacterium]
MSTNRLRTRLATLMAIFALASFQAPAMAGFIEGGIGFGGLFTPTGGTGLGDATGISFGFSTVTTATGDFAPAAGEFASFNDLDFNPANTPITPLWSVTAGGINYAFDLLDISLDFQDADEINLSGTGILSATGFDDTAGTWTFSGQNGSVFFTFSSITIAESVSEPSTLLLLGLGLVGVAAVRRRTN